MPERAPMPPPEPRQRGIYAGAESVAWRLDGRATHPEAPLLLCMHGYGMNEDYFAGLLQSLFDLPWNILTARAPFEATDIPGRAHSWYAYDGNQERFLAELQRTDKLVQEFVGGVESQLQLRPARRVLLGFSQGGYCGAYVALQNPRLFQGMVISGARVKVEVLQTALPLAAANGFRALLCHGRKDASVKPTAPESSLASLRDAGIATELRLFDSGHSMGRSQVAAIQEWLATTPFAKANP